VPPQLLRELTRLERGWLRFVLEPKSLPYHLGVRCRASPAVWEVLVKSVCSVRRGAVPGHQPCCP